MSYEQAAQSPLQPRLASGQGYGAARGKNGCTRAVAAATHHVSAAPGKTTPKLGAFSGIEIPSSCPTAFP